MSFESVSVDWFDVFYYKIECWQSLEIKQTKSCVCFETSKFLSGKFKIEHILYQMLQVRNIFEKEGGKKVENNCSSEKPFF